MLSHVDRLSAPLCMLQLLKVTKSVNLQMTMDVKFLSLHVHGTWRAEWVILWPFEIPLTPF